MNMSEKTIWVCLACGKRSMDKYGENPIDYGWDASCMLNSREVYEDKVVVDDKRDRVVRINPGAFVDAEDQESR